MTNSQTYPFSWFYGCQCRKDSSSWELRRLSVPPLNAICTSSLTCTRNNMDAGPMEIDEGGGTSWHVPPVPIPQFLIRWTETETEIEKNIIIAPPLIISLQAHYFLEVPSCLRIIWWYIWPNILLFQLPSHPKLSRGSSINSKDFFQRLNFAKLFWTRKPASRASKRARLVAMYIEWPQRSLMYLSTRRL